MSKLIRSLLCSGLVVGGVAACGDDVVVNPPVVTVHSVSVGPTGITISVLQELQMAAAVVADAGVATTVTWATSNANTASISTGGLVKGIAAGSVAITACSTVNAGVCGQATVTVSAVTLATISIQSITTPAGVAVPIGAVVGQIQVNLNVDGGSQRVTSVDALIDGVVASSQGFSAAQWQDLIAQAQAAAPASDGATANASVLISLPINTALFDATTGATSYKNGARLITARANVATGSPVSTPSTSLTFANANFIAVTTTVTGGSSANSSTGILWQTGDLKSTAVPVVYTSGTNVFQQVVLTPAGMSSQTLTAAPYTATWAKATSSGSGGSGGVESGSLGVSAASTMNGAAGPSGASAGFPFDNKAPSGGPIVPFVNWGNFLGLGNFNMPNGRTGSWINSGVVLNGLAASAPGSTATAGLTSNGFICNNSTGVTVGNCAAGASAVTDGGIGTVTYTFKAAAGTSLPGATVAAVTSATTLGESTTNTSYCGVAQAVDGLGNTTLANPSFTGSTSTTCSTLIGLGAYNIVRFGVDLTNPTVDWDASSFADNGRVGLGGTLLGNFVLAVNDPGAPATASGIQAAKWLLGRLSASSAVSGNYNASGATTTATAPTLTGAPACAGGLCSTAINTLATTGTGASFWTAQGLVLDAAGNTSPTLTRLIVGDGTAAGPVTGPSVPASISGAFNASGAASDNLDLRDFWYSIGYSAAALPYLVPATIQLNATPLPLSTFPPVPGTLQNTNVALGTTINTPLFLQATSGAGAPVAYSAAADRALNNATVNTRDQTGAYVASGQPITFASLVAPASGISTTNFTSFISSASNVSLCAVAAASAGCTVGAGVAPFSSTVITATAAGLTSIFNNPFARVDFYCTNGTVLIALGSSSSPVLNDIGPPTTTARTWAYSLTESASDLFAKCGGVAGGAPGASITPNLWAWGVNSAGTVALVAQPLGTVTILP